MTVRLFVALDLPQATRDELAAFGRAAADHDAALRAVAPESLHLTLAFLGARDARDVAPLAAAVRALAPRPGVALGLGEALWLSPRRPHVLTVAICDPTSALAGLVAPLRAALAAAVDWRPEPRPLRPHVTVARVRRDARPRRHGVPVPPEGDFVALAVTLYRSHLGGGPARYEALERLALA